MVVTPTYNTPENERLHFLLQAIYWTAQQTHQAFTHVIVNDGSTDETPELLEEIARNHDHIRVLHQENKGQSAAINFGVEETIGEVNPDYITLAHSDDLLLPGSLEKRVSLAQQTKSKMIYSDMVLLEESTGNTQVLGARNFKNSEELFSSLIGGADIPYPTMMWDADFFAETLGGLDESLKSAEDWDIALRTAKALEAKDSPSVLNQETLAYRFHNNNIRTKNLRDGTKWNCYKHILAKQLEGSEYQFHLARSAFRIARTLLPEVAKKPLRQIRDIILDRQPNILPYRSEFLEAVNDINYQKALLGK